MIYVIAYHQSMSGMVSINISPMFGCFQLCWCRWHPESWVGLENQDGQRQLCHTGLRRQHRLTSVQRPSPVCQYDGVDYPDRCCCSWSPTAHAWPIVRRRCRRGPRSDQWTRHLSIRSTARLYSGFNRFIFICQSYSPSMASSGRGTLGGSSDMGETEEGSGTKARDRQ
jgi:hypothetical protein